MNESETLMNNVKAFIYKLVIQLGRYPSEAECWASFRQTKLFEQALRFMPEESLRGEIRDRWLNQSVYLKDLSSPY